MTTTELTGAEDVAWDLSDLYESGADPRIEHDVEQTEAAAASFREQYYGRVAKLSAGDLREAIEERERIESTFTRAIYYVVTDKSGRHSFTDDPKEFERLKARRPDEVH